MKRILFIAAVVYLSGLISSSAFAQPLDFGDAPEGALAYPASGTMGMFPTCIPVGPAMWIQHTNFGAFFGPSVDFEPDGNGGFCPLFTPYDLDECFLDGDAGLIIPPAYTIVLPPSVVPCPNATAGSLGQTCQIVSWGPNVDILVRNFMPSGTIGLVNVLMDWDQNGMWAGASSCPTSAAPEHVLVNFPVPNGFIGPLSALGPPPFLIGPNPGYVWTRFTISERPVPVGWDGSGQFEDGESEDYLLRIDPQQQPTMLPVITECPVVQTECPAEDTRCPVVETKCPVMDTHCPVETTLCPVISTQCPAQSQLTVCPEAATSCPVVNTECPTQQTVCPEVPTHCPEQQTLCPKIYEICPPQEFTIWPMMQTMCPVTFTICPNQPTLCPAPPTECPADPTWCPPVPTQCPIDPIFTICPINPTQCPVDPPTECPLDYTNCPEIPTVCPIGSGVTTCPEIPTQCPQIPTVCQTVDPTVCPVDPTYCPLVDSDGDGVDDCNDNCPNHDNGPLAGTCTSGTIGKACLTNADCGTGGFCSKNQEDTYPPPGNNCGNACECEGNFDGDPDVDGSDAATFKADFGRSGFKRPCKNTDPCNGDFDCDVDVDGSDAAKFKEDFGRSPFKNPCPNCVTVPWCVYP